MSRSKEHADYAWLAEQLNKLKVTQTDGKKGYTLYDNGVSFEDLVTILETHHEFETGIPEAQCREIIKAAVFEAAKLDVITEKLLKSLVFKQINLFNNKIHIDYILVTSISTGHTKELKRLTFDQAGFVFSELLPPSYSRDHIKKYPDQLHAIHLPPGFAIVRVKVQARSDHEAFQKAIESLDYLRGIWNFLLNRGTQAHWYSGLAKPINTIRLGPVHTLHLPSGQPATTRFWYELLYPSEMKAEKVKKWSDVIKYEKNIRNAINKSNYKSFIKNIFMRYSRSLDSTDHESCFLKLWGLLETLTVMKSNENYDEVIKRALCLSTDQNYDGRLLEHLRLRRNANIHRGESSGRAETFIFQLKQFVEALITFHLRIGSRFLTPEEAGQLLSRPRDVKLLKKRIVELESELSLNRLALKLNDAASKTPQDP